MEQFNAIIELLKTAIENGQTVTIKADDVTITPTDDRSSFIVSMNCPEISTEG